MGEGEREFFSHIVLPFELGSNFARLYHLIHETQTKHNLQKQTPATRANSKVSMGCPSEVSV